ncbi:uncharacterized protein LOC122853787 [Aphidius gifuensis]|uniref:uncharacterized protein LOC122853787 n=1 Tax=Aphidius gifuensis TaxID=684658 RepID=UPI001CDBCEB2|nr:uncharacterized protein LOC122853787 [Aphidius gifuensis]
MESDENKENSMSKYVDKLVELELLKEVYKKNQAKLIEKNNELIQEKKILDELHHQIWSMNDEFCDKIWNTSRENNYYDFINKYLDATVDPPPNESNNDPQMIRYLEREVKILIREIDDLDFELKKQKTEKLEISSTKLQPPKFVFKTPMMKKLTSPVKSSSSSSLFKYT